MPRSPLHYRTEDLNLLKGKMVRITMDHPIKINGTDIFDKVLIGYFHVINSSFPPENYPVYLNFIHRDISNDVSIKQPIEGTTMIVLSDMAAIELLG